MSDTPETLTIGIPMYPGVDPLDVVAPYEVFDWMSSTVAGQRSIRAYLLAESHAPVNARTGITLFPHRAFHEVEKLDVLWVPGGDPAALNVLMQGGVYLDYVKKWAADAAYVCSVCEGAMLLAAAGLLDGFRATTHWAFYPCLESFPQIKVVPPKKGKYPRFIMDPQKPKPGQRGIRLTGGGISSGLDEALRLVELLTDTATAEDVQRNIQYFPDPPVNATLPPPPNCFLQLPS
ncbi:MAG TPA: DJ-1/PfpI family protein [Longimicrobium sp.]|jgi:cyclohexyl-isocyanide hydratase|nr:DJ-1/PfpI family protein [Longimicrobium sp.]